MEDEGLPPRVQHREDAEVRLQFGLCDIDDCLSGGAEENRVEQVRCNESEDVQPLRNGEDGVKVRNVEDLVATNVEPALACLGATGRTMAVAARVPEHVLEAAAVTMIAMIGERAQHRKLVRGEWMLAMRLRAAGPDDRAERGSGSMDSAQSRGGRSSWSEGLMRWRGTARERGRDVGIGLGGTYVRVPVQDLPRGLHLAPADASFVAAARAPRRPCHMKPAAAETKGVSRTRSRAIISV